MSAMKPRKPMAPEAALLRLEGLCSKAEMCEYEVRKKLAAWLISSFDTETIVRSLKRRRYVDNLRYAGAYVRDKYRFARWGRRKIVMGLRQKRIDAAIIEEALEEIDHDEYRSNLRDLLRAKARSIGDEADTYEGRTKLFRFGATRGFEPDMVAEVIRNREYSQPNCD